MKQIPEKLIEKKVSQILQKRQRDGVLGTRESAEEEAKNSLQSWLSRQWFRSGLLRSDAASRLSPLWKWTGIGEKKGWDFLQLAITASIPLVIFFGTQHFSRQNNRQQQEIATQRYQQETLTKYLEQMSQLLLDKDLRKEGSEARTIARARTLSTLRELDSFRKGLLIKFLAEAKLISGEKPVVDLFRADLKGADLKGAYLSDANLYEVNLDGAYLYRATLTRANLKRANLKRANLTSGLSRRN
jgi:hypothetical protein